MYEKNRKSLPQGYQEWPGAMMERQSPPVPRNHQRHNDNQDDRFDKRAGGEIDECFLDLQSGWSEVMRDDQVRRVENLLSWSKFFGRPLAERCRFAAGRACRCKRDRTTPLAICPFASSML